MYVVTLSMLVGGEEVEFLATITSLGSDNIVHNTYKLTLETHQQADSSF